MLDILLTVTEIFKYIIIIKIKIKLLQLSANYQSVNNIIMVHVGVDFQYQHAVSSSVQQVLLTLFCELPLQ